MTKVKKNSRKALTMMIAVMVGITFSFALTTQDVSAASKPGKVKSLSVSAKTTNSLTVKWKKPKRANKYKVSYKVNSSSSWKTVTVKSKKKTISKKLTGLSANTGYQIKIRSYKGKKAGKWSKVITGRTQQKPTQPVNTEPFPTKPGMTPQTEPESGGNTGGNTGGNSGGTNIPWTGCIEVPEDTNVTLSYGTTTIHLGQKWSNTVYSALKSGSSGSDSISRVGFVEMRRYQVHPDYGYSMNEEKKTVNQDVYMIDTKDYDNFLIVYVTGGRISKWATNKTNMGKNGSSVLKRGATSFPAKANALYKNYCGFIPGVVTKGLIIGGFQQTLESASFKTGSMDSEKEKKVAFHLINSYRALGGWQPLIRNKHLEGRDFVNGQDLYFTGSVYSWGSGNTYTFTNQRYGAQAVAETMYASDKQSGNYYDLPKGPLSGAYGSHIIIGDVSEREGLFVTGSGSNISSKNPYGESSLTAYDDATHVQQFADPDNKYIGIGLAGKYHCDLFSL